jgi:hypothetical protein
MDSSTPGSSTKKRSGISSNRSKKAKVITNFFRKILRNRSEKAKVITNFFRTTKKKRIKVFLDSVCEDSGVCMTFGKESKKIREFFDGFTTFEDVKSVKRIGGVESKSGFVNRITYDRDGYIGHSVLKSSRHVMGDNLVYEYLVGQFINKKCRIFPCFLETYGLYQYDSEESWIQMKQIDELKEDKEKDKGVAKNFLKENLRDLTDSHDLTSSLIWGTMCKRNSLL